MRALTRRYASHDDRQSAIALTDVEFVIDHNGNFSPNFWRDALRSVCSVLVNEIGSSGAISFVRIVLQWIEKSTPSARTVLNAQNVCHRSHYFNHPHVDFAR